MDNLSKDEALVDEHIRQNNRGAAVRLLFDLISKYARAKNFAKAEMLREKLFEADPMALSEIIRSGEIIEEEKSESIDQEHLEIWSDMYDALDTNEAQTLYLATQSVAYDTDELVFAQSELNDKLFFVNQGQLKLSHTQGEREILLRTLGSGDIAGDDTFFSISVCTSSLVTLSRAKLSFLEKKTFERWQEEFPGLASKLGEYCEQAGNTRNIFAEKGLERRTHKRIRISGVIDFRLLSPSGKPMGKAYKGKMADVSAGGLSFDIKMSKKNALLLLARKLHVRFPIPKGKPRMETEREGTIIGVTSHPEDKDHYTIRMKFDSILKELREEGDEWLKTTL